VVLVTVYCRRRGLFIFLDDRALLLVLPFRVLALHRVVAEGMRNLLAGLRVVHFDPNECGLVFVFWDVLLHETATARLDLLHDLDGHIHLFLPGAGLVRFPVTVDDLGELLVAGMLMFVETATKDDARRVRVLQEGDVGELVGRLLLGLSALDRHHLLAGELDGLGELLGVFLLDATALFQPSQVPFNKDVAILIDREMVSVDPECHQRVQAFRWRGCGAMMNDESQKEKER